MEVKSDFIDALVEEVASFSIQVSRFCYTNTSRWKILVRGLALVIGCIRSIRPLSEVCQSFVRSLSELILLLVYLGKLR